MKKLITIALLLVSTNSWAATRFYLPSTGTPIVSFTFSSLWERTSDADRISCVTTKIASASASHTSGQQSVADDYDVLNRQYVSNYLTAQTIDGTIKGQIRVSESNSLADMSYAILIRVIAVDGTVRGTLYSDFSDAGTEFSTSLTNRNFPPSNTLSSVNALAGDRIVIEIGHRKNSISGTSRTCTMSFGDDSASDLAEDETETTANNPWVEFSDTITFYTGAPASSINMIALFDT